MESKQLSLELKLKYFKITKQFLKPNPNQNEITNLNKFSNPNLNVSLHILKFSYVIAHPPQASSQLFNPAKHNQSGGGGSKQGTPPVKKSGRKS